jgi:hypothetical protein
MRGGTSAPGGSAQDRSIIEQTLDKHQNDLLPRQWNNESLNQAQTPMEWESQRLREGRVWSEYSQTPMTADQHHAVPAAADQRLTAETRTQTTTTCLGCQRLITTMLDEVTPWSNSRAR